MAIGVRFRQADASNDIGALALVLPKSAPERLMRLLGFLAAAKRPMRIFKTIAPAQRWIDAPPEPAESHQMIQQIDDLRAEAAELHRLKEALGIIDRGEIADAKTITLLQNAALTGLCGTSLQWHTSRSSQK